MKHIVFGGFDYAVPFEMDQNAIFNGIDYFVDNNPALIGTTYLGKEIKSPEVLQNEKKEEILILIGSIVNHTEAAFQLKDMGFIEDKHFIWAIAFTGDDKCPRLWRHTEWKDRAENGGNLKTIETGEYCLSRLEIAARLIDFSNYKTVIDIGAANERIRTFLPKGITYIPVDYISYSEETIICDINKYEFPSACNPQKTCVLSMENIQYCRDWHWYLEQIAKNCSCFILGHDDFARISREYRKTHWSRYNALFDHQIICYMLKLGFELTDAVDFRLKTTCYKFEKRDELCRH